MPKNKPPSFSAYAYQYQEIRGQDGNMWVSMPKPGGGFHWQRVPGAPTKEKRDPPKESANDHPGERRLGRDRHYWLSVLKPDGNYQWRRPTKDAAAAAPGERVVRFAEPLDPTPDIKDTSTVQSDYRETLKACNWISKLDPADMKSPAIQNQASKIMDSFGQIITKYGVEREAGLILKRDLQSLRHNCNRMGQLFKYLLISKTVIKKDASDMATACAWLTTLDSSDLKSPAVLRRIAQISAKTHEVVDKYDLNRDNNLIPALSPKAFKHNCKIINESLKRISERP